MTGVKPLVIIPARGGSKGVPRKNIRRLGGVPLVAWSISAARHIRSHFSSIVVSTDDPEIAEVSREYGAEVPWLRAPAAAGDNSPMVDALRYEIERRVASNLKVPDWILLLQPTVPFRHGSDILEALKLAESAKPSSVISVVQVFAHHPILMKKIEGNRLKSFCIEEVEGTRRQDYHPPAYMRNGSIYLTRTENILKNNSIWGEEIYPIIMPESRSINIDSEMDFALAETFLANNPEWQDSAPVGR